MLTIRKLEKKITKHAAPLSIIFLLSVIFLGFFLFEYYGKISLLILGLILNITGVVILVLPSIQSWSDIISKKFKHPDPLLKQGAIEYEELVKSVVSMFGLGIILFGFIFQLVYYLV